MIEEGFTLIFQSPDSHIKKNINFAHLFRGDRLSDGVMAAQEILVLLVQVRILVGQRKLSKLCMKTIQAKQPNAPVSPGLQQVEGIRRGHLSPLLLTPKENDQRKPDQETR